MQLETRLSPHDQKFVLELNARDALETLRNAAHQKDLLAYGYPDEDQVKLTEITRGLELQHVGILIPLQWQKINEFLETVVGEVASVSHAKSVLVKERLGKRLGVEADVQINYVTFKDPKTPPFEIFTVERPVCNFEQGRNEFTNGFEVHLAFGVPPGLNAEVDTRLKEQGLSPITEGKHLFTGEHTRYFQFPTYFKRHFELLSTAAPQADLSDLKVPLRK